MKIVQFLIVLGLGLQNECANILYIQHAPSYSHYILCDRIVKSLAERGHSVTLISLYKQKEPVENLREIVVSGLSEIVEEMKSSADPTNISKQLTLLLSDGGRSILENENVKQIIDSKEHFDVIIMHKFGEELLTGLSYYFNAPYIILSTIGPVFITNEQLGIPGSPSYMSDEITFFDRVSSSVLQSIYFLKKHLFDFPRLDKSLQELFPGAPPLIDLYYNVSLYLLNSHPSFGKSVPTVANAIDIGGFHVNEPKPLPNDIQSILDNAKHGAIFFSMGSNIKASSVPNETKKAILSTFSKLKQTVLWKFEEDKLPNKPENVHIRKWLPQQDILAHENVKLFISHGGLLSTTEAIFHGVPILGIPVFGDQMANIHKAVKDGYALAVPFKELNEENLSASINELLKNKSYFENMKERSRAFNDRPVKPLDLAVYWIEYVIRNRGAPHLKSITTKLKWYQLLLLDVVAFLLLCFYITVKIFFFVIKKAIKLLLNVKQNKVKTKTQ